MIVVMVAAVAAVVFWFVVIRFLWTVGNAAKKYRKYGR